VYSCLMVQSDDRSIVGTGTEMYSISETKVDFNRTSSINLHPHYHYQHRPKQAGKMRQKRAKTYKRVMALYTQTFGFRTPFQILGKFHVKSERGGGARASDCAIGPSKTRVEELPNGLKRGAMLRENWLINSVAGYTVEMSSGIVDLQSTSILCSGRIKVQ